MPGQDVFYGKPAASSRNDLQMIVAVGTEEYPDRRSAASNWFGYWASREKPWALTRIDIAGGTHSADAGHAYRAALRQLFAVPPAPER